MSRRRWSPRSCCPGGSTRSSSRWPLGTYRAKSADGLSRSMLERLAEAEAMTLDDYRADIRKRMRIREIYGQLGGLTDGVITLSATGAAPLGLQSTGDPDLCRAGLAARRPRDLVAGAACGRLAARSSGDGFRATGRRAVLSRRVVARSVRGLAASRHQVSNKPGSHEARGSRSDLELVFSRSGGGRARSLRARRVSMYRSS